MPPVGRPRTVSAPPCPSCETEAHVTAHGLQEVDGEPRRAFRCARCRRVFVPGVEYTAASAELKAAVRRVRAETEVPYRLLAEAVTRNLGVAVSHTTVAAWCREQTDTETTMEAAAPCEYLSVLWALQREIQEEARKGRRAD